MGPDADIERLLRDLFWPLVIGAVVALAYLGLLGYEHRRMRLLVEMCRKALALREKQEGLREGGIEAPPIPRFQALESRVRQRLAREGLRPAPKPRG